MAYAQAAVSQAAKSIVAFRKLGGSWRRSRVTGWDAHLVGKRMQHADTESDFARKPVLEHCAFFTCVQCGYCGYLILGGSAKELLDEEERHAIECKATHDLIGAGMNASHYLETNE